MMKWLKRIGVFAAALIALEVVAYVGLLFFGPSAIQDIREIWNPPGRPTEVVAQTLDNGAEQKCSTYQGEVFCITDGQSDGTSQVARSSGAGTSQGTSERRCADYEGETICLTGGN